MSHFGALTSPQVTIERARIVMSLRRHVLERHYKDSGRSVEGSERQREVNERQRSAVEGSGRPMGGQVKGQ